MAALALGPQIFGYGFRLLPTPEEAVTYYLPRLVAGTPLHDAVRSVIHHADVYASSPADLARHFCPLPKTGDRFFFSPKRAPGAAQASRTGSWQAQNTADIKARGGGDNADAKVGELKKLRYKNRGGGGGYTDWLMDEYSSCSGAGEDESQFVLCKMYVSPRAASTSTAHKESAAYFSFTLPPPPPAAVVMQPAPAVAPKRTAPPRPAMSPPCAKRMRGPAELLARPAQPPAPPAPTLSSGTAIRNMPFAPPQPCAPRRVSTTPSATQPSPVPAPLLAPPAPTRRSSTPPQPLPEKQVPLLPTAPVVRACHVPLQLQVPEQSKQRRTLDPFEAAMLRDEEAEEKTVAAAPHLPPPPPAATPALQDEDDWADLEKALEFEE